MESSWQCICQWLSLTLILVVYLISGTALFHMIEQPYEAEVLEKFNVYIDGLYEEKECLDMHSLRGLAGIFGRGQEGGRYTYSDDIYTENNSLISNWAVPEALFFSFSAISTIGYGNIVPWTSGGRLFCIFYSFFGIPIVIALGTVVGCGITTLHRMLVFRLVKKFRLGTKNKIKITLCKCIVSCAMIIAGVVLPSFGFATLYHFTMFEMFYFTFVTMSTIGFGDFVPEPDAFWQMGYRLILCVAMVSWCVLLIGVFTLVLGLAQDATTPGNGIPGNGPSANGTPDNGTPVNGPPGDGHSANGTHESGNGKSTENGTSTVQVIAVTNIDTEHVVTCGDMW